jgi:hypothetical protein
MQVAQFDQYTASIALRTHPHQGINMTQDDEKSDLAKDGILA